MVYAGLLIVAIIGFVIVNLISSKFTLLEKIGLSFIIGISAQTLLMLFMDLLGIKLSAVNLLISGILLIIILCIPLYPKRKEFLDGMNQPVNINIKGMNLVWFLFIALIIYFEVMNFAKCMYYPTIDRDSLTTFDTVGYVIGKEGTFKNLSLFQSDYMTSVNGPGGTITYIPMLQLSYAYVYALGATTSKLIPALMYLFFLVAFYGAIRRITGATAAAIATFFMMITPDMLAFSSLSATNVIHAISASLGIIYITLWFKKQEKKDLYMGAVLLAANVWCRLEGMVFVGAALCVIFFYTLFTKKYKDLLPVLCSVIPLVIWTIYMKINGIYGESVAITHFFVDAEKADTIYKYMKGHFSNTLLYGWTFIAALVSFIINIPFLIKKRNNLALLCMIVLALIFYSIILYQIDYKWDSIHNVLAYSAKRFLYCFVPLFWFYTFTNETVLILFSKLDNYLMLKASTSNK